MSELKIVGWAHFDNEYPTFAGTQEEIQEVFRLVAQEVVMNNYVFSGQDHQNVDGCAPILSDGRCFRASMRAWGLIMAIAYQALTEEEFSYMDFYTSSPIEECYPVAEVIDVAPANIPDSSCGCLIGPDQQMLQEVLQFDMPLMTFDKVVKKYHEMLTKAKQQ